MEHSDVQAQSQDDLDSGDRRSFGFLIVVAQLHGIRSEYQNDVLRGVRQRFVRRLSCFQCERILYRDAIIRKF